MPATSTHPATRAGDQEDARIAAAWQAVRRARQIPWQSGNGQAWAEACGDALGSARALLDRKNRVGTHELAEASSATPGAPRYEHGEVIECIDGALDALASHDPERLDAVVQISEAIAIMDMRLATRVDREAATVMVLDREQTPAATASRRVRRPGLPGRLDDDWGPGGSEARRRYALGGD